MTKRLYIDTKKEVPFYQCWTFLRVAGHLHFQRVCTYVLAVEHTNSCLDDLVRDNRSLQISKKQLTPI